MGLLYAFDNGISPYISYSTSFEPNLQTRRAPGSAPFEPSEGRQLEAGIKYLTPNEQTLATLSIYQLQQRNVTNYNAEKAYFEPVGEIRSRGIEAQINSQLTENISFISSYAYTDTEVRKPSPQVHKEKNYHGFLNIWHHFGGSMMKHQGYLMVLKRALV